MRIQLNGEPRELPGPLSVQGLLDVLGLDPRLVAVEVNRIVVKRQAYDTATITAGAEVEIVAFVGGGCLAQNRDSRRRLGPSRELS